MSSKKIQILGNIDADTLDGKHANEFMSHSDMKEVVITLLADNWIDYTQTINIPEVTETNAIVVSSRHSSTPTYTSRGVYCSGQSTGKLTFGCKFTPTEDLEVNVLIIS